MSAFSAEIVMKILFNSLYPGSILLHTDLSNDSPCISTIILKPWCGTLRYMD